MKTLFIVFCVFTMLVVSAIAIYLAISISEMSNAARRINSLLCKHGQYVSLSAKAIERVWSIVDNMPSKETASTSGETS